MGDQDPKYRELPPTVDSEDLIAGVDTRVTEAEHGKPNPFDSADPPSHIVGWG
ncbi:hypothetical protein ACTXG7_22805 [Mycolicibacterium sp. Dal123E01]|uniref:hypothetical protein n=1 Tax=Mycolicibacterium sp. Dal123E01 TaxID=3457578 RepID=UPI00403E664D